MQNATQFILLFPVLVFSVVAHEYAHGYAALKQGDPTAYQLGRLTFNPIKHIDPVMTILVPAIMFMTWGFIFGGAKPVPVNPRNYRKFKQGDIIVSLAGIATNVALAFACTALIAILGILGRAVTAAGSTVAILQSMLDFGIQINLILAMFNLLPIPPLDGSHVMKYILPPAWALRYQTIGAGGLLILMLLLVFFRGALLAWLAPAFALDALLSGSVRSFLLAGR